IDPTSAHAARGNENLPVVGGPPPSLGMPLIHNGLLQSQLSHLSHLAVFGGALGTYGMPWMNGVLSPLSHQLLEQHCWRQITCALLLQNLTRLCAPTTTNPLLTPALGTVTP